MPVYVYNNSTTTHLFERIYTKGEMTKTIRKEIKEGNIKEGYNISFYDSRNKKFSYTIVNMKKDKDSKEKLDLLQGHNLKLNNSENSEFKMDIRAISWKTDSLLVNIYMWRHEKYRNSDGYNYSYPFEENEEIYFEFSNGTPYRGKIYQVDNSYYGGDCIVLYTKANPRYYLSWLKNPLLHIKQC
jgi:hypothetical protein